jgi:hypothetical protein
MADKQKSDKGEMRRRWRAMLDDGSLAALRSEGRLAALYVLYAANWSSCQVRLSMRRAAKAIGVHPTTVRRGISQMIDGGLLEVLEPGDGTGTTLYMVPERARLVRTPDTSGAQGRARLVRTPDTSGAQGCARLVRTPDTSGARSGHEPCAERARVVRGARTLCARNSFSFIGSSRRINDESREATPGTGLGPAPACLPPTDEAAGEAAAG